MTDVRTTARPFEHVAYRGGMFQSAGRVVAQEVPVAFSYGGTTHAVMMATPGDLVDFAYGFSLTEGIVRTADDIVGVDIVEAVDGLDVQVTLADHSAAALKARRRAMAGPVGCGMCGIESIEQAVRAVPDVSAGRLVLSPGEIVAAVESLNAGQRLNAQTRAVHGAGFYVPGRGLVALREDVGRHNALDKLAGALLRQGVDGESGAVVVTSRVSVEMVQKSAILGASMVIAISAPTALAIETAEAAGMTLVALVRGQEFDIFTHAKRVGQSASGKGEIAHVA
jgi:FdhD protein